MEQRIAHMAEEILKGNAWFETTDTPYDRKDLFLPHVTMSAKRAAEYILNQTPVINENTALTGYLRFDGSVEGDIFNRAGHENFRIAQRHFYNQPVDGLATFEWQHSVADYQKVLNIGMEGYLAEIEAAKKAHQGDEEAQIFLAALTTMANAVIAWAHKCSDAAKALAEKTADKDAKARLGKLAEVLKKVPEKKATTFFEAVQTIFLIYTFVPDSIGTLDRFLYPYYQQDIANGTLTREEAKAYLQELFLMLQSRISIESKDFYRGGESHFCVGGYLPNGEDCFNELSKLIVESLMELPTYIPQISLRWTKKTPREVFRYMLDCERKDKNKRIAFVSDEPRIKALHEIGKIPYEVACNYTMVGCNEPQLPGGIFMGGCDGNLLKAIEGTVKDKDACLACKTYEEFYELFRKHLHDTVDGIVECYNHFQTMRARDINLVSTMFFEGSVERAKSITQGGATRTVAAINVHGIINVVDSLAVIRKFVFEDKTVSMETLLNALDADWNGYEDLHALILHKTPFFGNDHEISNSAANDLCRELKEYFDDKVSDFGYHYLLGNLIGYNEHHKFFGDCTCATPDGRHAGEALTFGIGQIEGKDREGLTALLNSVANFDQSGIFCGPSVTNILLEHTLVENDANFEKLVLLLESYFQSGGLHFQLTYVSPEDMKKAKVNPDKYSSLRVRVSGFSDFFVRLNEPLQDDIIRRTEKVG